MALTDDARRAVHNLLTGIGRAEIGPFTVTSGPTNGDGNRGVWVKGIWFLRVREGHLEAWTILRGDQNDPGRTLVRAAAQLLELPQDDAWLEAGTPFVVIAGPLTIAAYRATQTTTVAP